MNMSSFLRVAAALIFFMSGSAFAQTGGILSPGQVLGNFGATAAPAKAFSLYAATNAALQAISSTTAGDGVVYRGGFSSAGDGGEMAYVASNSACSLNSGNGDNGSQVKSADSKCWIAQFSATGADVRAWGAQAGQNIDAPLTAAIAYACSSHVPLTLPYPLPTTPYFLNSSIHIGNGTATHFSDCNAVSFSITQPLTAATDFNTIQAAIAYNGTNPNTIPLVVQGPISDIHLSGINITCANICKTGIEINNSLDSDYGWLGVQGNCGAGFVITSVVNNTFSSGNEGSHFHDWQAAFPTCSGGSGMQVGDLVGQSGGPAVIANMFDNITLNYDANTASSCGINLAFATQLTFINLRIAPMPGTSGFGHPICITPPSAATNYPTAITFLHPLIAGGAVQDPGSTWTGTFPLNFINWSTVDEPFPTSTNPNLFVGSVDTGAFTVPSANVIGSSGYELGGVSNFFNAGNFNELTSPSGAGSGSAALFLGNAAGSSGAFLDSASVTFRQADHATNYASIAPSGASFPGINNTPIGGTTPSTGAFTTVGVAGPATASGSNGAWAFTDRTGVGSGWRWFATGGVASLFNVTAGNAAASISDTNNGWTFNGPIAAPSITDSGLTGTGIVTQTAGVFGTTTTPTLNAIIAGGSAPTLSGTCSTGTQVGGNTAGTFKASAPCAAGTVILTFATAAPNGWVCNAHDQTTPTDAMNQTANSTTSCTLTGAMASADVVAFDARAF